MIYTIKTIPVSPAYTTLSRGMPSDSDGQDSVDGLSSAGSHESSESHDHSPLEDDPGRPDSPTKSDHVLSLNSVVRNPSEPITAYDRKFKTFIND